ncbi:hypothetical protein [[Mycoplasma] mobile]|nr:hypothetical protein [[Mycoplasma] mobile]
MKVLVLNFENNSNNNSTEEFYFKKLKSFNKNIFFQNYKNNLSIDSSINLILAISDNDIQNSDTHNFINSKIEKHISSIKNRKEYFKKYSNQNIKKIVMLPPEGLAFEYFLAFHISEELSLEKKYWKYT